MDFCLNDSGDIFLDENGNEAMVVGDEHISQNINQKIRFVKGDYFLAKNHGLPWMEFYSGLSLAIIESMIKTQILSVEKVTRMDFFKASLQKGILFVEFCVFVKSRHGENKICNSVYIYDN